MKRVCTVGWALVGLMVAALLVRGTFGIDKLEDPEQAFGFACRHLLFPGSLGLLIACVLAANMSTASAFMVSSGALFTEGLYRRHLAPGRPDRHYLLVGRLSGFVIAMAGVVYAVFLVDKVLNAFLLVETMSTFMGVSFLGGIIWRRANRWGAMASIVAAFTANFIGYSLLGERLDRLALARDHARQAMRVVRQNLIFATAYNAVGIPLALAGWLPPWLAGLGMAGSSLIVVLNALRLAPSRMTARSMSPDPVLPPLPAH